MLWKSRRLPSADLRPTDVEVLSGRAASLDSLRRYASDFRDVQRMTPPFHRARASVRSGSAGRALAGLVHTVGLGGRPLR